MSNIYEAEIRRRLELLSAVQPTPQATDRALARVRQTLLEQDRLHARKSFWRSIMDNRWSKLAVAAGIVLAVAIGLNMIGGRHMGGVAWSQLLENMQHVHSYTHRTLMTISRGDEPDTQVEFVMVRSTEYGIRRDAYVKGELVSQLFLSRNADDCVELVPGERKYVKTRFSEEQLVEFREKNNPKKLAEMVMSFDHTPLETKTIEGKVCEGIEVTDPRFGRMLFEQGKAQIWADVETNLLVLMELEGTSAGGAIRTRVVLDRFQWDAPLTAADFEPNIPDDYEVMAEVDLSSNEQTLIKGLRRFAEITGGQYPSSLDLMTSMREVEYAFVAERRRRGVPMQQQPTKDEMSGILAIQGASMYYGQLMNEDQDVAYHGAKVSAAFPHAVLMRWKGGDDCYRVLFGDLTVQEATAEELVDLEAMPLNTESYAVAPEPADGVIGTAVEGVSLKWLDGATAVRHQVYFGTDPAGLPLLATVDEAQVTGLPTLQRETTYYWRVDEINADGSTTPGHLWHFDTGTLVGWWTFDKTDGDTVFDSSGRGHEGTLIGGPNRAPGAIGGALEFDGDGDYVDLGTGADFDVVSQITVAAWIKVNAFDMDWQAIVTKGDTAWRLSRSQGDNLHFACTGFWPEWVHGSANVNDGQWHHVAGLYDGAELRLYVDGRLDVAETASGSINVNGYPVIVGANAEQPGRAWNGLIDDVRIYNYALSAAEIQALVEGKP